MRGYAPTCLRFPKKAELLAGSRIFSATVKLVATNTTIMVITMRSSFRVKSLRKRGTAENYGARGWVTGFIFIGLWVCIGMVDAVKPFESHRDDRAVCYLGSVPEVVKLPESNDFSPISCAQFQMNHAQSHLPQDVLSPRFLPVWIEKHTRRTVFSHLTSNHLKFPTVQ